MPLQDRHRTELHTLPTLKHTRTREKLIPQRSDLLPQIIVLLIQRLQTFDLLLEILLQAMHSLPPIIVARGIFLDHRPERPMLAIPYFVGESVFIGIDDGFDAIFHHAERLVGPEVAA